MIFAMKWESPSSQWKANRVGPSQLPAPGIPGSMDLKQGSSALPHNTRSSTWAAPRGMGVGGLGPSVDCPPQWACLRLFVMDSKVERSVWARVRQNLTLILDVKLEKLCDYEEVSWPLCLLFLNCLITKCSWWYCQSHSRVSQVRRFILSA